MTCTSCSRTVPEGSRFCPHCAAPADEFDATRTSAPHSRSSSDPSDHGRFLPGTMLGGRYRVVGLLGRGGMGEVYRADDLKLGQAVALKFLPAIVENDAGRLQRFLNEVKIARQISHPSVCRVYDVGEVDGHHYLSMEYVDGEDLASLLRRIGRLPKDKAVEISRQLCTGLAAAHEQGILHRDLKPANVMIDGRGRAKITDFGLATLAGTIRADEMGVGTPLYMAPEQRAGKDVTVRSDLYSLGLVLYELFTGHQAFKASTAAELARLQAESTPTSPARLIDDLDPAVERAILRCLEKEPRDRPLSAIAVAASLPGGDPLAAALAAGETPSPEMVAAAGETGALRPAIAWACLASVIVGLALVLWLVPGTQLVEAVGLEKSPEVLAERAREIVRSFGYQDVPLQEAFGFIAYPELLRHIEEGDTSLDRWKALTGRSLPAIVFWYRASPRYMTPSTIGWMNSAILFNDPPATISGMVRVYLDPRGRLLTFLRVPPQRDLSEGPFPDPDWANLLREAKLDPADTRSARPIWHPLIDCDARTAWDWTDPKHPGEIIRFEAGAYHGQPVYFDWWASWDRPFMMEEYRPTAVERVEQYVATAIVLILLFGGALLARRNLRLGRGDKRGALKLAVFFFSLWMVRWLVSTSHIPSANQELVMFLGGLGSALSLASLLALTYVALEPYARKMWPQILISWSRLLAGGLRDPLVGRDLIVGCLLGTFVPLLAPLGSAANRIAGYPPLQPSVAIGGMLGLRDVATGTVESLFAGGALVLVMLFFLVLFRIVLRKPWAAATAVLIGVVVSNMPRSMEVLYPSTVIATLFAASMLTVLVRFGLLAALVGVFAGFFVGQFPIPSNLSAWYAGPALFAVVVVAALAAYGFHCSLGGRSAFENLLTRE